MKGGGLQEVSNIVTDLETFGTLENWSLRRGGRLREMVATGGSEARFPSLSRVWSTLTARNVI